MLLIAQNELYGYVPKSVYKIRLELNKAANEKDTLKLSF